MARGRSTTRPSQVHMLSTWLSTYGGQVGRDRRLTTGRTTASVPNTKPPQTPARSQGKASDAGVTGGFVFPLGREGDNPFKPHKSECFGVVPGEEARAA